MLVPESGRARAFPGARTPACPGNVEMTGELERPGKDLPQVVSERGGDGGGRRAHGRPIENPEEPCLFDQGVRSPKPVCL